MITDLVQGLGVVIRPTEKNLELARQILRRGAAPGEPIQPCACFRQDHPLVPRCNGVCEEAAFNVAMALDRAGDGVRL